MKVIIMHLPGDVSAENNAVTLQELLYVVTSVEKVTATSSYHNGVFNLISLPLPPPRCKYLKLQPMQCM